MLYTIHFRLQCPFDRLGVLPPQASELRCILQPGSPPLFSSPNVCDHCSGTNFAQCQQCISAVHLMFRRGLIPLELSPSCPVVTLPSPIRPSLSLLSE